MAEETNEPEMREFRGYRLVKVLLLFAIYRSGQILVVRAKDADEASELVWGEFPGDRVKEKELHEIKQALIGLDPAGKPAIICDITG